MKRYEKKDFPVTEIRRFLEPGPVVLVSSAWKGKTKAHVATVPRYPRTLHYRGDGVFMLSGPNTSRYRRLFRPEML